MKPRISRLLTTLMCCSVGVALGRVLFTLWDYKQHPGLYALRSAPWYTDALLAIAVALGVCLLCGVAKLLLRPRQ